jgi:hypothetical protein
MDTATDARPPHALLCASALSCPTRPSLRLTAPQSTDKERAAAETPQGTTTAKLKRVEQEQSLWAESRCCCNWCG